MTLDDCRRIAELAAPGPAGEALRMLVAALDAQEVAHRGALESMTRLLMDSRSHARLALADARRRGDEARRIVDAAELACGLLWMHHGPQDKAAAAYEALRTAIGGPGSPGLRRSIERAMAAAVSQWPRKHRYLSGTDLRRAAMRVAKRAQRAWRARDDKPERVARLVRAVDAVKINLQLGMRLRAFRSFAQFEALARVAADLGRQAGGWHRQLNPKGQNRAAPPPPERAQTLSTCAASAGANA